MEHTFHVRSSALIAGFEQEEDLKQLTDIQVEGIRRQMKSTLDYLESEHITKHDLDY